MAALLPRAFSLVLSVAGVPALSTAASGQAPRTWMTVAAGLEHHLHLEWPESRPGPTFAIAIGRGLGGRLHLQAGLSTAMRGRRDEGDVTTCPLPPADCVVTEGPRLALGAAGEFVLYDQAGGTGGYVVGGLGVTRFSGGGLGSPRYRPRAEAGLGVAIGSGPDETGRLHIELRVGHQFDAEGLPRWSFPLRIGWRFVL